MPGNVLIGVVRNREQLAVNLEHKFYHIPAGNVPEGQEVDFVALYLSQASFGEGGVGYVGKVVSAVKLPRGEIKELPAREPEQPYFRFDVAAWTKLEPAVPVGGKLLVCAYTWLDELFCGRGAAQGHGVERRAEERRSGFRMSQEDMERVVTTEVTVTAPQLAARINDAAGSSAVTKGAISDWLTRAGLLYEAEDTAGRVYRTPSRAGIGLGIVTVQKYTEEGRCYRVVKYREEAQKLIIRHINSIMNDKNTVGE